MPRARPSFITLGNLSTGTLVLIIASVLLIIVGSFALIYTTESNKVATGLAHSTSTAQTRATTLARAFTGTAGAELDATTIAQANASATAQAGTKATATAQANTSATAQANANITATAQANAIATAHANATATAQAIATSNPYPPYGGTLALNDPLTNNSQGHNWDVYAVQGMNNCQFVGGAYQGTAMSYPYGGGVDDYNSCNAENTNFANFAFQVQLTIVRGSCGGITFRSDSKAGNHYSFIVCSAGFYEFRNSYDGTLGSPFAYGPTPAIHQGPGQTNVLAVVAIGNAITLYVNGQKIASVTNSIYTHGQIGCEAAAIGGVLTGVIFHNAMVWTL